ncbi:MAG: hypothetical protein ACREI9_08830 [Nitrospiraceae bacterium]
MTGQPTHMSPVKLGLAVAWPAFWTGVPIKIVLGLLLLAMGQHPWEFPGLAFLLLLSIPVDIWAVGLTGRTVFLERLGVQPPASLGLTLWWQGAALYATYGSLACFLERQTIAGSQAVAAKIMDSELLKAVPVAERISIELVLWGSVSAVVLLALTLGGLFLFGKLVQRQADAASPASAPYAARVHQWDLMRVPADQPLMLTVFTATGVALVLLLWAFMPVTTPHPHESYKQDEKKAAPVLKPMDALQKAERVLTQAETSVQALETKAKKSKGKAAAPDKKAAAKPKKA